jgi:spermidine/putrescine transport system permease protein
MAEVQAAAPAFPHVRGWRWNAAFLALPLGAWLVFFFVLPFALILWYSFGEKPSLYVTHSNDVFTFARYVEALDPAFLQTFVRTLRIAIVGTVICLLVAFPIAYWMAVKLSPRWRTVVLAAIMIPYWTNFLVRTIGWQITLSPEGFLSHSLQDIGLIGGPLDLLYTPFAVQLGVVYNYLPLMILPLFVALDGSTRRCARRARTSGPGASERSSM